MDLSASETKGNVLIKSATELLNYSKTEEEAMGKAVSEIAVLSLASGFPRADTTARLDALLDEIGEIDGVLKTTTSVVLALRIDRGA